MKKIKISLFFIILIFLGLIIYQNNEYFLDTHSLLIDLKLQNWQWNLPYVMNIGYFGIFFGLGFLFAGYLWIFSAFKSRKIIKLLNRDINSYHDQVVSLKTELDKFNNDPYIKQTTDNHEEQSPDQAQST